MKALLLTFSILMLLNSKTEAQDYKRTANWYFGDSAGLSFNTNPPTVLTDGAMYALEGCATISDTAGNLLFYTNGLSVWNRDHQLMVNGTGLLGAYSASQAALIVPQPGNDSIYYIFTCGTLPLCYSVVNINLANGLGEIVEKNVILMSPGSEKLVATHHSNGTDIWVSTHEFNTNSFFSFLVTSNGIVPCPVISSVGSTLSPGYTVQGEMKFTKSGKICCNTFFGDGYFELLNFNNTEGKFSNPVKINVPSCCITSAEFSHNEKRLYIIERWKGITEYPIDTFSATSIINGRKTIYDSTGTNGQITSSINGDLFFNNPLNPYIGIIKVNADTAIGCVDTFIKISPRNSTYGFPNFISSYLQRLPLTFRFTKNVENSFSFESIDTTSATAFQWSFFKSNQLIHTSIGRSTIYTFPDTGGWIVKLIATGANGADSVSKEIYVYPIPMGLGADTIVCADSLVLDAGKGHCYQWSDSSTDRYFTAKQSGSYSVKIITEDFSTAYDTIQVILDKHPVTITITRNGDSLVSTSTTFKKYQWYKNNNLLMNDTLPKITLTAKGSYQLVVKDFGNCSGISNSVMVDTLSNVPTILVHNPSIYPNPATESDGIFIESDQLIKSVTVYTLTGIQLREYSAIQANTFHLESLPKGIYFIGVNKISHFKIIIY